MQFLYSIVALLMLQEGNAFSVRTEPSGKAAVPATSSRMDFLQLTSAAAFASLVGVVAAPQMSVAVDVGGQKRFGSDEIMVQKEHGTSAKPVLNDLLYDTNTKLADKICSFNR